MMIWFWSFYLSVLVYVLQVVNGIYQSNTYSTILIVIININCYRIIINSNIQPIHLHLYQYIYNYNITIECVVVVMIVDVNVNNLNPNNKSVDVLTYNKNVMKTNMNNWLITYWSLNNNYRTNIVKWRDSIPTK